MITDDPDSEEAAETFVRDLRAAYDRGQKAKVPSNTLAILMLTCSYSILQLTFDLDEEQFWRMVAETARRHVVSGAFERAREENDGSRRIH